MGLKTMTYFRGTPTYVSKEMLKLFSVEEEIGFVDLYTNDLECFLKTKQYFDRAA